MKPNKEFSQELVDLIEEQEDGATIEKVSKAVLDAVLDKNGKGDSHKTFMALAKTTSMFLKMWANMAKHEDTSEMFDSYTDVLDFYCFLADHPVEDE